MATGILMALSQIGISLAPMLAGLGVAGFIIGFALQDSLGNFAAGAMIYVVVEELIPESQLESISDVATIGAMLGFAVMMTLDVALG